MQKVKDEQMIIRVHTSQKEERFLREQNRDRFEKFLQLLNILCSNICINIVIYYSFFIDKIV